MQTDNSPPEFYFRSAFGIVILNRPGCFPVNEIPVSTRIAFLRRRPAFAGFELFAGASPQFLMSLDKARHPDA
jgi:hypothetical protein